MKALLGHLILLSAVSVSLGSDYQTKNFVIRAPHPSLARQVGELAEKYRKELSVEWLGYEIEPWSDRCPISVRIAPLAGGQTSFGFVSNGTGKSVPVGWEMEVFGPVERILDSVLPHEITHTIFATHFGCPLPRWADEGACTTIENISERKKIHRALIHFLKTGRGIPFNRMFAMKEYPHDIIPLYAQGYSLARYLIMKKGKRHFVKYIKAGIENETPGREPQSWNETTREFYGFRDLSDLQVQWNQWVLHGSKPFASDAEVASAAKNNQDVSAPARQVDSSPKSPERNVAVSNFESIPVTTSRFLESPFRDGWYARQIRTGTTHDGKLRIEPEKSIEPAGPALRPADANPGYRPGSIGKSKSLREIHSGNRDQTLTSTKPTHYHVDPRNIIATPHRTRGKIIWR